MVRGTGNWDEVADASALDHGGQLLAKHMRDDLICTLNVALLVFYDEATVRVLFNYLAYCGVYTIGGDQEVKWDGAVPCGGQSQAHLSIYLTQRALHIRRLKDNREGLGGLWAGIPGVVGWGEVGQVG